MLIVKGAHQATTQTTRYQSSEQDCHRSKAKDDLDYRSDDKTKVPEESTQSLFQGASDKISELRSWLPSRTTTAIIAAGGAIFLGTYLCNKHASDMSKLKFDKESFVDSIDYTRGQLSEGLADSTDKLRYFYDEMKIVHNDIYEARMECWLPWWQSK